MAQFLRKTLLSFLTPSNIACKGRIHFAGKCEYCFDDKVALVTGGTTGIGYALVQALLCAGVEGVLIADSNEERGKKMVVDLGAAKTHFAKCDVTKQTEFDNAFKEAIKKYKHVDIVVNSAGVMNEENFEQTIAVNVGGCARGTILGFDYMGKDKGGQGGVVVNISSTWGLQAMAGIPLYSGTSHFQVAFSRGYGVPFYFDQTKVRVISLLPGATDTEMIKNPNGRKRFKGMHELALKQLRSCGVQKVEEVGEGLITAIKEGDNGTSWIVADDDPTYEAPPLKPTIEC